MTKRSFFSLAEFGLTWATDTMRVIQLFWNLLLWWISTGFAWVREHFLFKIYVLIDTLTYYLCHVLYFLVQFCKSYTMIHLFILWIRENICSSMFESNYSRDTFYLWYAHSVSKMFCQSSFQVFGQIWRSV